MGPFHGRLYGRALSAMSSSIVVTVPVALKPDRGLRLCCMTNWCATTAETTMKRSLVWL